MNLTGKLLSLIVTGLLVAAIASTAEASPATLIDRDAGEDCDEWAPDVYEIPIDPDVVLPLRVYVLLDGISLARGEEIMKLVTDTYAKIGVDLRFALEEIIVEPDTTETRPGGVAAPAHSDHLIPALIDAVHGARPWGFDVVFGLTSDAIAGAAGFSDCIGGVRYAERAFGAGEASEDGSAESTPATRNESAKIATHEIAHLLGGQHHYANCAETDKGADLLQEYALCTVLINDVGLASDQWSTLETSVVRAHVSAYARASTLGPEPIHGRRLRLRLTRSGEVRGWISSSAVQCEKPETVTIQRLNGREWRDLTIVETLATGNFSFELPSGVRSYRAWIPDGYFVGDDYRERCASAISNSVQR